MKDPNAVTVVPKPRAVTTGLPGTPPTAQVSVNVIDGEITCTPHTVIIFDNEEVEWLYPPGNLTITFKSKDPFGTALLDAKGAPSLRSGPCKLGGRGQFKYTVIIPGLAPQDPVVDADPRQRPPIK